MSRDRYYYNEAVRASNIARRRASYLIMDDIGGRVSNGQPLGIPTWCQLKGIERKALYHRSYCISTRILLKLADELNVSTDYLLGRTDKKEVNR